jgi:hypothetical protein
MGSQMKTTIDLSDSLFHSAKEVARQSQTTLRALIEVGLRRVLSDHKVPQKQPSNCWRWRDAAA